MPKWGVTKFEDGKTPWGLPQELLKPAKTITDPVHGDIYVNELECLLLSSPPMQRLRRVRQLGTTHLVYPGATHSRFSHALGTLRAAQDLLDALRDARTSPDHGPDLLDEWEAEDENGEIAGLRFSEATVLARLGALLHDLCHVPLGHTIEDDLKVLVPHDKNEARFAMLWKQLNPAALKAIKNAGDLEGEIRHLVMSKVPMPSGWQSRYPFVEDIVGNTICADLMDYLRRDHQYAGLPMTIGHRFLDHFYVIPSTNVRHGAHMAIRTARHGQRRQDITTELEKYLRYRYELTERVLNHHAKTSADAMIGKLLEMWSDATWLESAAKDHGGPVAPIAMLAIARVKEDVGALATTTVQVADGTDENGKPRFREVPNTVHAIDEQVRARLEDEFTSRSDDGLLEHLTGVAGLHATDERWQAIDVLAKDVLDRRLYKRAARADSAGDLAEAHQIHKEFGSADARRDLEQAAAKFAGITPGWKLVIWLPEPAMRLKVAGVLVDTGESVAALDNLSEPSKQIVQAHRALWAVTIYAEPKLLTEQPNRVRAALAFLGEAMGLALHDPSGQRIPDISSLAVDMVARRHELSQEKTEKLGDNAKLGFAASKGGTFDATILAIQAKGEAAGLPTEPDIDNEWWTWSG